MHSSRFELSSAEWPQVALDPYEGKSVASGSHLGTETSEVPEDFYACEEEPGYSLSWQAVCDLYRLADRLGP